MLLQLPCYLKVSRLSFATLSLILILVLKACSSQSHIQKQGQWLITCHPLHLKLIHLSCFIHNSFVPQKSTQHVLQYETNLVCNSKAYFAINAAKLVDVVPGEPGEYGSVYGYRDMDVVKINVKLVFVLMR